MEIKFEISCGLDTNGHDVDANAIARDLAAEVFPDGHTIIEAQGRYLMRETGQVVDEPTLIVVWLAAGEQAAVSEANARVGRFVSRFKALAFQESVLVTRSEIDAVFC